MANRIFQGVILQMKETAGRTVGVVDADGVVVACSDVQKLGEQWGWAAEAIAAGGTQQMNGFWLRTLGVSAAPAEYAAFAQGEDEETRMVCGMAAVALSGAKAYYEEKYDRATFVKSIISDNILLGDIYVRAKELHFPTEQSRAVILVHQKEKPESGLPETIAALFPDKQNDFVLSANDRDIVIIKQVPDGTEAKDVMRIAKQVEDAVAASGDVHRVVIGAGTVTTHLRNLARSYKEAQVAIEVGEVFDTDKVIINYENLGIGRLIYQLPTTLCGMFLQEVFKKSPIDALDEETLFTINKFFENNLNVSETARKLFVHRNTLVYRLEKIKKLTGLDLREFDDAITFKVALMVKKYLVSRGIES